MFATMDAIGVIGGSGLYQIDGLEKPREITLETPYGKPSDSLMSGLIAGRQVYFLPRHARGHRLLPTELNHRANIYALRSLDVRWIISVGAVGVSIHRLRKRYAEVLREEISHTVSTPADIDDEVRHLIAAVGG